MDKIIGDEYHIKPSPDPITFKLVPNSEQGELFIDIIKLDQKTKRNSKRKIF